MLNRMRNRQGFTLIELLIVVAIIGILAAIAIPQFSSYRQKGFNSAAVSDVKNAKTAEESLFADHQTYGTTSTPATLAAAVGTGGAGAYLTGATPVAGTVFAIAGIKADGTVGVVGVGVSNGVQLRATTLTDVANTGNPAYVLSTKHSQGTRAYAAESGSTAIMYVENVAWAGQALNVPPTGLVGIPVLATMAPQITSATAGGGVPVATWSAL